MMSFTASVRAKAWLASRKFRLALLPIEPLRYIITGIIYAICNLHPKDLRAKILSGICKLRFAQIFERD